MGPGSAAPPLRDLGRAAAPCPALPAGSPGASRGPGARKHLRGCAASFCDRRRCLTGAVSSGQRVPSGGGYRRFPPHLCPSDRVGGVGPSIVLSDSREAPGPLHLILGGFFGGKKAFFTAPFGADVSEKLIALEGSGCEGPETLRAASVKWLSPTPRSSPTAPLLGRAPRRENLLRWCPGEWQSP